MAKDLHRGTTAHFDTVVYTDDTFENIKDVTGFTVLGRFGNTAKRFTHLEKAGIVVNGPAGQVRVSITSGESADFPPGDLDYQCFVTDGGGQIGVTTDQVVKVLPTLSAPL